MPTYAVRGATIAAVRPEGARDVLVTWRDRSPIAEVESWPTAIADRLLHPPERHWGLFATTRDTPIVIDRIELTLARSADQNCVSILQSLDDQSCADVCVLRSADSEIELVGVGRGRAVALKAGGIGGRIAFDGVPHRVDPQQSGRLVALSSGADATSDGRAVGDDAIRTALAASETPGDAIAAIAALFEQVTITHDLSLLVVFASPERDAAPLAAQAVAPEERDPNDSPVADDALPTTAL